MAALAAEDPIQLEQVRTRVVVSNVDRLNETSIFVEPRPITAQDSNLLLIQPISVEVSSSEITEDVPVPSVHDEDPLVPSSLLKLRELACYIAFFLAGYK